MGIKTPRPAGQPKPVKTCDWLVTTTYQNLGKLVKQGCMSYTPIRTTRGAPRFPLPYETKTTALGVMPDARLLSLCESDFRREYRKRLDLVGFPSIAAELDGLKQTGKPLALLCFCKTHSGEAAFCHRHIFAEWWKDQTGEEIVELAQA